MLLMHAGRPHVDSESSEAFLYLFPAPDRSKYPHKLIRIQLTSNTPIPAFATQRIYLRRSAQNLFLPPLMKMMYRPNPLPDV